MARLPTAPPRSDPCRLRRRGCGQPRLAVALAAVLLLVIAAPSAAQQTPGASYPSSTPLSAFALTSGWQFAVDPHDIGLTQNWQSGNTGTGWHDAPVPSVFDAQPQPGNYAGTAGWYRVTFTVPPQHGDVGWALNFEQVRRNARVWLNGTRLGSSGDPWSPFTFAAPGVQPGLPNTLVVRVDNRLPAGAPPPARWNWGGITRPVEIVPQQAVVSADTSLMPQLRCTGADQCSGGVLYDATLSNRSAVVQDPHVSVTLTAPEGGTVSTGSYQVGSLAPGQSVRARFVIPISGHPDLWAPGHPALYSAQIITTAGTVAKPQTSQVDSQQVGLRAVNVHHGQLYLNGQAVRLSGASIEEDMLGHGPVLSANDQQTIVSELRTLHANIVRATAPLSQALLRLLDQAGIMVWSEPAVYRADALLASRAGREATLNTLRSAVLQTRSHPSVITHAVGDELSSTPDQSPGTRAYLQAAAAVVNELDPTLPVSIDIRADPSAARQIAYAPFALVGVDDYFGWQAQAGAPSTASLAALRPYLTSLHHQYAGSALVLSKLGAEANRPGLPTDRGSYAFQAAYLHQTLQIATQTAFVSGSIVWGLRDYAIRPRWYGGGGPTVDVPRDSYSHRGLITYRGALKPAFAAVAASFAATPLYRSAGGAPWTTLALTFAILAAIALVVALDVWLFAGIGGGGAGPPASGLSASNGSPAGARESAERPRTYA